MFNNRHRLKLAAFICTALFVVGLGRLFWLRFERGDFYPPYSSFRSDPLGIQVLYESLARLGNNGAERNFRPFDQASMAPDAVFFICGLRIHSFERDDRRLTSFLETVASSGGRLVMTFTSVVDDPKNHRDADAPGDPRREERDGQDTAIEEDGVTDEAGVWGLGFSPRKQTSGSKSGDASAGRVWQDGLPANLPWRSFVFFELYHSSWETVYRYMEEPVVIKRSWGQGEVIVIADSYLFSNEALRNHRAPAFLAWALPPDRTVIFDEYHHGLSKQPGIAGLARKYRLHGVVLSLVVLVILMIWRQAAVFVPESEDVGGIPAKADPGRDSAEGWVSLAQQHIVAKDLLNVCHEAWRSSPAADRVPEERLQQILDLVDHYGTAPRRSNLVAVYRSISELLKQGKIS